MLSLKEIKCFDVKQLARMRECNGSRTWMKIHSGCVAHFESNWFNEISLFTFIAVKWNRRQLPYRRLRRHIGIFFFFFCSHRQIRENPMLLFLTVTLPAILDNRWRKAANASCSLKRNQQNAAFWLMLFFSRYFEIKLHSYGLYLYRFGETNLFPVIMFIYSTPEWAMHVNRNYLQTYEQ